MAAKREGEKVEVRVGVDSDHWVEGGWGRSGKVHAEGEGAAGAPNRPGAGRAKRQACAQGGGDLCISPKIYTCLG